MGFPSAWKQELINIARANNPNFKIEFGLSPAKFSESYSLANK